MFAHEVFSLKSELTMSDPSLLNIPYRFKASKLYSQIPDSGLGDFTVTRSASNVATRVNAQGFIETVADNVPRLDYPLGGIANGCPALLVEPSAQNLIQRSEEFNDSYWGKVSGGTASVPVVTPNVELAPDGTNNADRVVFALNGGTTSTDLSGINSATLTHSASSFTSSIYIRTTDGSTVTMTFVNADGTSTNRTITPTYQRITYTSTGAGTAQYRIRLRGGVTSDSASVAIWGAQYEAGSIATSYIPTTTGSVTRNADVISVSGAVSGSIGQASGTIYAEVDVRNLAIETYIIRIDEGASSNIISLRKLNTNQIRTAIVAPTTSGTLNISSAAFTAGIIKIAFAYKSGEIALSVNGATALTANGTFAFGASLNRITLGSNASASSEFNDRIRAVALYTTRLSNAQLAALTT